MDSSLDLPTKRTLRFLADQLTTHRFVLRKQTQDLIQHDWERTQLIAGQNATRRVIEEIKRRFDRELDRNPQLRAEYSADEGDEQ